MATPLKIGIGLVGLAAISSGGIGLHYLLIPSTIGDELLKEGKQLVLLSDDSSWKTLADNHIKLESTVPPETSSPAKIEGLSLKDKSEKEKEDMKNKCQELLKTEIKGQDKASLERKRKEARNWCVLEGDGFKVKANQ